MAKDGIEHVASNGTLLAKRADLSNITMSVQAELHEILCGECVAIIELKPPCVTLGRSEYADISCLSKWASRRHAIFEMLDRKWCVTDKRSANGIYVDGKKLDPEVPYHLKNGALISLGPTDLTVGKYQFWFSRTFESPIPPPSGRSRSMQRKALYCCTGTGCKRYPPGFEKSVRDDSPDILPLRERLALKFAAQKGISPYEVEFRDKIKKDTDNETDFDFRGSTPKRRCTRLRKRPVSQALSSDPDADSGESLMLIAKKRYQELKDTEEKYHAEIREREAIISRTYAEMLEKNFSCPVCMVLLIKATTLGCGHTFCEKCVSSWKKHNSRCPMCRDLIVVEHQNMVLDDHIESFVNKVGPEYVEQRKKAIEEQAAAYANESSENVAPENVAPENVAPENEAPEIAPNQPPESFQEYEPFDFMDPPSGDFDYFDDADIQVIE